VIWQVASPMIVMALVGALAGALLGGQLRGATLTHVFGFFLLFLGLQTLALVFADPDEQVLQETFQDNPLHKRGRLCGAIGLLHGTICGLLGISGGVVATPMQQLLLQMPVRHAIAHSLIVSVGSTGLASLVTVSTGVAREYFSLEQLLVAVLCVGLGALLGALIGARLGTRVNSGWIRLLFVVIALGAGFSILL